MRDGPGTAAAARMARHRGVPRCMDPTRPEIYLILSGELSWSPDRITDILTTVVRNALLG